MCNTYIPIILKGKLVSISLHLQIDQNIDDLFDSILAQVEFEEFSRMSGDDLRNCVIEYVQQNRKQVEVRASLIDEMCNIRNF